MSEPLTIAFDTSAAQCAAALLCGDDVIAERLEPMEKGHAERLFPMLAEILSAAGADWGGLSLIGVGTGPGNFTGVRIAVAAARGLALGLGIPAIGVSGLHALAFRTGGPVRTALRGPRGGFYIQDFLAAEPVGAPQIMDADDPGFWPEAGAPTLVGDWPEPPADRPDLRLNRPGGECRLRAIGQVARLLSAAAQPRPAPLYLRPPDASPPSDPPPAILP